MSPLTFVHYFFDPHCLPTLVLLLSLKLELSLQLFRPLCLVFALSLITAYSSSCFLQYHSLSLFATHIYPMILLFLCHNFHHHRCDFHLLPKNKCQAKLIIVSSEWPNLNQISYDQTILLNNMSISFQLVVGI